MKLLPIDIHAGRPQSREHLKKESVIEFCVAWMTHRRKNQMVFTTHRMLTHQCSEGLRRSDLEQNAFGILKQSRDTIREPNGAPHMHRPICRVIGLFGSNPVPCETGDVGYLR